jgi:hypothetical protein
MLACPHTVGASLERRIRTESKDQNGTRNNCKRSGDHSWLAYQLYARPNAKVNFGHSHFDPIDLQVQYLIRRRLVV